MTVAVCTCGPARRCWRCAPGMFPNAALAKPEPVATCDVSEREIDQALAVCQKSYGRDDTVGRDREAVRFNIALGKRLGIRR